MMQIGLLLEGHHTWRSKNMRAMLDVWWVLLWAALSLNGCDRAEPCDIACDEKCDRTCDELLTLCGQTVSYCDEAPITRGECTSTCAQCILDEVLPRCGAVSGVCDSDCEDVVFWTLD
jgi:hypothetical protein